MPQLQVDTADSLYETLAHPIKHQHQNPHQHQLIDDASTIASSPTSSWDSSRRSSYSSFMSSSSYTSSPHLHFSRNNSGSRHNCKSLPPLGGDKAVLYPTRKAAHDRIEWLEEQMLVSKQSNESIVKSMSHSIQSFLENRQTVQEDDDNYDLEPSSSSSLGNAELNTASSSSSSSSSSSTKDNIAEINTVLQHLIQLKELVQSNKEQECIAISVQKVDTWISSVTMHKQSTKRDLKNVVVPLLLAAERERERNTRLTNAIQRLSHQKKASHHDAICQTKQRVAILRATHREEKKRLRKRLETKLDQNMEEQKEMEQVMEAMRKEMEVMLDELDQNKQQQERYRQKAARLHQDLKAIVVPSDESDQQVAALQALLRESETQVEQLENDIQIKKDKLEEMKQSFTKEKNLILSTHSHQVDALVSEKEELRSRLVKSEQKLATEQKDRALEEALARKVTERDCELAKLKFELERSQRHTERLQELNERQMQRELKTRLDEMESDLKSRYKKESDTYQLRLAREIRDLSGQMVELETELQEMEDRHQHDIKSIQSLNKTCEEWKDKEKTWKQKETEWRTSISKADQRISSLEKEALILYGKNLELAQHLGELDS